MKVEDFIKKHKITLNNQAKKICQEGIKQMYKSKDPIHGHIHIFDIIGLLDRFINESNEINKPKINFNILLPAICWHDIWKSQRHQTTNLIQFKFEQIWDGIGSSIIFKKYAKQNNLKKHYSKKIHYAILYHGGPISKYKRKNCSLEAKILDDLDSVDFWSLKRLKYLENIYLDKNDKLTIPALIPIANWILHSFSKKIVNYYFQWCQQEFERRKDALLKRGHEIMHKNQH